MYSLEVDAGVSRGIRPLEKISVKNRHDNETQKSENLTGSASPEGLADPPPVTVICAHTG